MENLRDRLIRLAFEKKALRPHLLPLIKQASRDGEEFKQTLLDAGIPERDLYEQNPAKILREAADYIMSEGLFEAFESGPLSYRDLKVMGFHEEAEDVLVWDLKLLLPWPEAAKLVLYAVADDKHVRLASQLASDREFQQLVSKNMSGTSNDPMVYVDVYEHAAEHVDFRLDHEVGYERYRDLEHEAERLKAKWTSRGLEIEINGQSW